MTKKVSSLERKQEAVEKRVSSLKTVLLVLIVLSFLTLVSTLLPLNSLVQKTTQKKAQVSHNHSRIIKEFEEEMGDWKEEFRRRMQVAEKVNMKWECEGSNK